MNIINRTILNLTNIKLFTEKNNEPDSMMYVTYSVSAEIFDRYGCKRPDEIPDINIVTEMLEKLFCDANIADFKDELAVINFNTETLSLVENIIELSDIAINNAKRNVYYLLLQYSNKTKGVRLAQKQFVELIDGIKQAAVEILETHSEKITPAKNAAQKVMFLYEIGVFDFIKEKYSSTPNRAAKILSIAIGEKEATTQRCISDILTGTAKNNPYNNVNNKVWLENTKRKLKISE